MSVSCRHAETEEKRTVFRYNESAGITSLDPAFAKDQANIWACNQLFNGLVQLDSQLRVQPCIARNWSVSEDKKTYTFLLRKDVRFHETEFFPLDTPRVVKAADVVYSFQRITDPQTASPGAWIFQLVDTLPDGRKAFEAIDDTTLRIRLKESFPPFLGMLSMQYCAVVLPEAVEHFGKDFRKHPVGTGPFRMKMWKEGVKLVCTKNPLYFEVENGERLPYLDAVAVTFIVDKQSVFMEFVKGNLDFMSGLDASYKDELLDKEGKLNPKYAGRIRMLGTPYLNTEYLGFLMDPKAKGAANNPLMKKAVRQAINYGFDREKMLRHLRSGIGIPGCKGMIPPILLPEGEKADYGYTYQPKRVRALLAGAGYPDGKGLPVIPLYVSESYMDIMEYIAHEVEQFGIRLQVLKIQPAMLRQFISQSEIPFFRASWIADYPDAENYLSLFYAPNFCPNGPNYTHYRNPAFDRLYEQSQHTLNDSLRQALYLQMDRLLMEDAPVVVLYYDQVLRFIGSDVRQMETNAMNLLTLKRVKKDKTAKRKRA
ncbi:MAG: ABC transporter substrate-binding protein [Bacteroidales bacterium]|nr:ABC transporter substrate-binding protein [Bacteroidales bacterium]